MKAAVLGAGGMGCAHIAHLKSCPDVTGVIACDVSEERCAAVRRDYGIAATTDLDGVLADPEVRLAVVAASNDAHKALTLRALAAGKAVLCEKPMANSLADAREMVETAERLRGFLQVGFEARYSRLYSAVKERIDRGLLGKVVNTHCCYLCSEFHGKGSWRNRKTSGGSLFGEKLSHYVDLPRWWIGSDVTEVHSVCAPNVVPYFEIPDNYHTSYRFADGAVSQITFMMGPAATFEGDPSKDVLSQQRGDGHALRYLVVGTKGAVETDVFERSFKRWEFGDSPRGLTSRIVERLTWPPGEDHAYYHNSLDQARDVVRRVVRGLPPWTPSRDSFETMRLCFAAEQSAEQRRAVHIDEVR